MIIPQYWAEAQAQHRERGKQVTVRRFGWSEADPGEAATMAEARAQEALARVLAGEKLARREPKVAYNGAEGVPIREEVLACHGNSVITRNLYGARCLNSPEVLFADVDFSEAPEPAWITPVTGALMLAAGWLGHSLSGWGQAILFGLLALLAGYALSRGLSAQRLRKHGTPEQQARTRIDAFVRSHPDWRLRLYRTPAGFRLLALQRLFDPGEPPVAEFFTAIAADKVYVRMCQRQRCFRARVSPKPWRIGIAEHVKPRPGVWPIKPERLPERERWVDDYERRSEGYASCRFVDTLGEGRLDADADRVRELHDQLARANSELPLA